MKIKSCIASLFFLALVITLNAQSSKKQDYSFKTKAGSSLSIENSFGDIDIEEFDGNIIEVNVEIIVEAKNSKNTEEYLSKIYVEAKEQGNEVILKTINQLKGMKVNNFKVNYDVKIPRNTNLNINNTFGDLKVQSASAGVALSIQHGDCFLGKSEGNDNIIKVEFGDLRIIEAGNVDVSIKHGDVTLGSISDLNLYTQFGDASIQNLKGNAKIKTRHGDLGIDLLGNNVNNIEIDVQFSDIDIEGLGGKDFKIYLNGSFTDFDFDSSWHLSHSAKDYNVKEYELLTSGKGASGANILKINASHSDVDLD